MMPTDRTGRLLGLDLGSKRIGVSISDSDRTVATPLEVIEAHDRHAGRRAIAALVDEWEITTVVVGMPLHLSGARGESARSAERMVEVLRDTLDVPVVTYDERLTTVTAHRLLDEQNVPTRERRDMVDMVAAQVILQGWIDESAYD
ncbi:MAG: Holliday junction resolvase RuvX [Acidimicrobiales bacterium]